MTAPRDLLAALTATDPGRPRITWYVLGGPADGERVELSGAVLANWASKAANLLQDELDAGPGTRVLLDLPPHWRSAYWALAAWAVGAEVVTSGAAAGADVVVTAEPAAHTGADAGADAMVVVTLPALARAAVVPVPAGAIDEARELATFGDAFTAYDRSDDDSPALDAPPLLAGAPLATDPGRHLLTNVTADIAADVAPTGGARAAHDDPWQVGPFVARLGRAIAGGGSLVLVDVAPGTPQAAARLGRICEQERVRGA